MWTVWVIAYLMAMAPNTWYTGFRHAVSGRFLFPRDRPTGDDGADVVHHGRGVPAAHCSNLYRWLQSEEDPDEELYHLVRRERSRGFFGTNP